jgi:elongation factor Ts
VTAANDIPIEAVKALREETGAGIMDCKRALTEAGGDAEKAKDILRQRGLESAERRAGRETSQGLVQAYVHTSGGVGRIGALVEVNCETDFVARSDEFQALARHLAQQVAAMNPRFISKEDAPPEVIAAERLSPEEVEAQSLLSQPFIRDNSRTVAQLITEVVQKTGENVRVRRFARFELGR